MTYLVWVLCKGKFPCFPHVINPADTNESAYLYKYMFVFHLTIKLHVVNMFLKVLSIMKGLGFQ